MRTRLSLKETERARRRLIGISLSNYNICFTPPYTHMRQPKNRQTSWNPLAPGVFKKKHFPLLSLLSKAAPTERNDILWWYYKQTAPPERFGEAYPAQALRVAEQPPVYRENDKWRCAPVRSRLDTVKYIRQIIMWGWDVTIAMVKGVFCYS